MSELKQTNVLKLLQKGACIIVYLFSMSWNKSLKLLHKVNGLTVGYFNPLFLLVSRNSAIGLGSMSARVGGILAPYVVMLVSVSRLQPEHAQKQKEACVESHRCYHR